MSTLAFNAVYEDAGSGWANARTCRSWPRPIRKGEGLDDAPAMVRDAIELARGATLARRADPGDWVRAG